MCPTGVRDSNPWMVPGNVFPALGAWGGAMCVPGSNTCAPNVHPASKPGPRQEGVRELGAQASPNIRVAPTPAVLMLEERLGHLLSCVWVCLPTEGLEQFGNMHLYC